MIFFDTLLFILIFISSSSYVTSHFFRGSIRSLNETNGTLCYRYSSIVMHIIPNETIEVKIYSIEPWEDQTVMEPGEISMIMLAL